MTVNPLLHTSDLPYHLPAFADIRLEHAIEAFDIALVTHRAEIDEILAAEEPNWANTVEALEASGQDLGRVTAWLFNLQGTDATEELDAVVAQVVPRLSEHSDAIYQDAELYRRLLEVDVPEDNESSRLYAQLLRSFTRRGAGLSLSDKQRLSEINQQLSSLSEQFGRALLADTTRLAVRFDDPAQLAGLSQSRIDSAHAAAEGQGWLLPLELPSVQSAQVVLENPASRAQLHAASGQRGVETNVDNLVAQVRLRAEHARLLGYDTHADYVIAEETAGTAEAARALLFDLAPAASANAVAEHKLASELAGEELSAADWPYWQAKVRERDYQLDEDALSHYFPLDQVLTDGVFFAAQRLYGVSVQPRADLQGYAEGVDVWEIIDADGTGLGLLLTDYFARPSKRGGAWMSSFVDQSQLLDTKPVVVNVMSITQPTDGSSPLLSIDQVTTLFHEFGHALHGLLSNVRYPSLSGTNVPRDWVEFPSQINENWAFDPEVVRNYARHVDTGQVIPDELIDAVLSARQFGQGFDTSEYLAAAIIDLAWHSLTLEEANALGGDAAAVEAFEQAALEEAGLAVDNLSPRYRSSYFNHIFGGGYSAGYYSYLWAEALDADGFDWFAQAGDIASAGSSFRDLILSRGASVDYQEAFRTLRGRERDVRPLLARRGLAGVDVG
ncbi:M3 family metallopeptidase [Corynebacterium alimapuense]|uniref:Peptidase n=1 Tax=Corynebacterium alimapuense TaxID=1576874 RepID=A0A3M8K9W9_9CORY|nr:M3 family metallopeptidase [Corynebacterium alimapuense]RNE49595.1 peptidase [Corynebacterium alimapuense]